MPHHNEQCEKCVQYRWKSTEYRMCKMCQCLTPQFTVELWKGTGNHCKVCHYTERCECQEQSNASQ